MKAVYLALGLIMTGYAGAATTEGSVSVTLTITTRCSVDGKRLNSAVNPDIACGQQSDAQPKVTQSVTEPATASQDEQRLVTVEW